LPLFRFVHVVVALALSLAASAGPAASHHTKLPPPQAWAGAQVVAAEKQDIPAQVAAQRKAEEEAAAAAAAAEQQRQQAAAAAAYAAAHPAPVVQAHVAAPAAAPAGSGDVQQIIRNAFSPYGQAAVDWGLRVARCESGYNPHAYNPAGPYYGLFQFLMSTFKATPYGGGDIYDPVANANAAAWKYGQGGQSAWGCN
jgi:hypothetical protein